LAVECVTARFPKLTEIVAWVSYLDIYGFKSIVGKSELTEDHSMLFSKLSSVHSQLAERIHKNTTLFILSDNYFIVNPVGQDRVSAYENCLGDVRAAIDLHIKADLPLRGGIAYGRVAIGPNVLVGRAVVRAVDYERLSRVPLVMLPAREVELANIVIQPPKFIDHNVVDQLNASGIISSTFVVPVNPRSYVEYCEEKYTYFRVHGPEKVAKDWLDVAQVLSKLSGSAAKGNAAETKRGKNGERENR